jgi:hypothetical protein
MALFQGKPTTVNRNAAAVADKFSDLSRMQELLNQMPEEERAKVGDVDFTTDSIIIRTAQVGEITLKVTERTQARVVLSAVGAPVPLKIITDIKAIDDNSCEIATAMDVEIPAFLKPMVGGAMQKAVDQFGELMQKLA